MSAISRSDFFPAPSSLCHRTEAAREPVGARRPRTGDSYPLSTRPGRGLLPTESCLCSFGRKCEIPTRPGHVQSIEERSCGRKQPVHGGSAQAIGASIRPTCLTYSRAVPPGAIAGTKSSEGLVAPCRTFRYSVNPLMAQPCQHCGAEKTESATHGFLYTVARVFGYRLRKCSRCRRLRLLPRHERPAPSEASDPGSKPAPAACPRCGSTDYRRSRRGWWERLVGHGPMARCRTCHQRFPYSL